MNDKLFDQLMESLHQGEAILKGGAQPSRRFDVTPHNASPLAEGAPSPEEDVQVLGGSSSNTPLTATFVPR